MPGVTLSRTAQLVRIHFAHPHRALSCAVLNGGYCDASDFINVKVARHSPDATEDPVVTLQHLSDHLQCVGQTVGMMTAASLDSLRVVTGAVAQETLAVVVTTGLANARSTGDIAEYRTLDTAPPEAGTINMAIVTSAQVTEAALLEMVTVATEAKVAVMHELAIKSPVSGRLATGTGTDAVAVFSGRGAGRVRFAGKHTLMGEQLGIMVMQAIHSSVHYKEAHAT